jgi:hypothetical protein
MVWPGRLSTEYTRRSLELFVREVREIIASAAEQCVAADEAGASDGASHAERSVRPTVERVVVEVDRIKADIMNAFSSVGRPGNWALRGSNEGEEPYLVEQEFVDKEDWRTIDAAFLDQAPGGLASALSFLSDEAFRYFLPAYLLADLDGRLHSVDPAFHLCFGLDDATRSEPVNPRRYGPRTWLDERRHQFAVFTAAEARAIVGYLRYKAGTDEFARSRIDEAIRNYWSERAA